MQEKTNLLAKSEISEKYNIHSRTNGQKKKTLYNVLFFLGAFVLLSFVVKPLHYKHALDSLLGATFVPCNSHGVLLTSGGCFCDLGYSGDACSVMSPKGTFYSCIYASEPNEVEPLTMAIFTEYFGSLNVNNTLSIYYESVATQLKKSGVSVTVVYLGPENPQFSTVASLYKGMGINLEMLSTVDIPFGNNVLEHRSFSVYSYLRSLRKDFAVAYFSGSSGSGYYSLNAKKQGIFCQNTKLVVGLDAGLPSKVAAISSLDDSHIVTDVNVLKSDFLYQKSAEFSDFVISVSSMLLNEMLDLKWKFVDSNVQILRHIPSKSYGKSLNSVEKPKEIVFIGTMDSMGGLPAFCDAIDKISSELSFKEIAVTFLGHSGNIMDLKSEEYIELRALRWDSLGLKWSIKSNVDLKIILDYMTEQNSARLAVMPSLFDAASIFEKELLNAEVPMIGSLESSIVDLLSEADSAKILTKPEGSFIADAISKTLLTGMYRAEIQSSTAHFDWLSFLSFLDDEKLPACANGLVSNPLVSVVLVHHNRVNLLKQAIESLEAQTYKNFEVILVDDGSTDSDAVEYLNEISWKWWEEKGWKVIREPNRYLGASRNTGVKHSNGEYVLFMDDDDYAKPHQIETFVKVASITGASVLTSGHDIFIGDRPPKGKSSSRYIPLGNAVLVGMLENVFGDSAMFVKREYFIESGGFTELFGVGFEDYEFLAKVAIRGDHMEAISEPLHWYRMHQGTMSQETNLKANQLRMLQSYIDGHWAAGSKQKALLMHTQKRFFEQDGIEPFKRDMGSFLGSVLAVFSNLGANMTSSAYKYTTTTVGFSPPPQFLPTFAPNPCSSGFSFKFCSSPQVLDIDPRFVSNSFFKFVELPVVIFGFQFSSTITIEIEDNFGNYVKVPRTYFRVVNTTHIYLTMPSLNLMGAKFGYYNVIVYNNGFSSRINFVYYDYDSYTIDFSYSPKTYTGQSSSVVLYSTLLMNTATPMCTYFDSVSGTFSYSSPAVYDVGSADIICNVISFSYSTSVLVGVILSPYKNYGGYNNSLYLKQYALKVKSTASVTLPIYAYAPVLTNAIFTDDGAGLMVTFSGPVSVKGYNTSVSQFSCSDIFELNPYGSLGTAILGMSKFDCIASYAPGTTSILHLKIDGIVANKYPSQVIKPFDMIFVKNNSAVYRGALFSDSSVSSTLVYIMNNPPVPKVVPFFTSVLGKCSQFSLNLLQSTGGGGRAWTDISIDVTSLEGANFNGSKAFANLLTAQIPGYLSRSSQMFSAGPSDLARINNNGRLGTDIYTIIVSVSNVWGKTGYKSFSFRYLGDAAIPDVTLNGPSGSDIDPAADNSVTALVKLPSSTDSQCMSLANETYAFSWIITGALSTSANIRQAGSSYKIAPYSLLPLTTYSVSVSVIAGSGVPYVFSLSFTTKTDTITTNAGSSYTLGTSQAIILTPFISNRAYRVLPLSQFTCSWSCITIDGTSCLDVTNSRSVLVLGTSCSGLTISAGVLAADTYAFTVTATNNITKSVSSSNLQAWITVVSGTVPIIRLRPSSIRASSNDPQFQISAFVDPSSVTSRSNLQYTWTSESTCNFVSYATVDLVFRSTVVQPPTAQVLKFYQNILTPGSTYCFKLVVSDPSSTSGISGTSNIVINVLQQPYGGLCQVIGAASDNSYSMAEITGSMDFSCSSWSTDSDSYPLMYSFEFRSYSASSGYSDWKTLSPNSRVSTQSARYTSGLYQVRAKVSDASGSSSTVSENQYYNITCNSGTFAKRDIASNFGLEKRQSVVRSSAYYTYLSEWLTNQTSSYRKTKSNVDLISALGPILTLNFTGISSAASVGLQTSALNAVSDLLITNSLTLDDSGSLFVLNMVNQLVGTSCSVPSANIDIIFNLLKNITASAFSISTERGTTLELSTLNYLSSTLNLVMCSSNGTSSVGKSIQNTILNQMSTLAVRRASCGEVAYNVTLSSVSIVAGKYADSSYLSKYDGQTYGSFGLNLSNITISDKFSSDGCANYQYGSKSSQSYSKGSFANLDSTLYQMSFLNSTTGLSIPVSSDISNIFNITLSSSFVALSSNISCAFMVYSDLSEDITSAVPSTSGCITNYLVQVGSSWILNCNCNHLSDFVAVSNANVVAAVSGAASVSSAAISTSTTTVIYSSVLSSATSATSSASASAGGGGGSAATASTSPIVSSDQSTSSNVGAIVGGVVGGLVAVALIAAGIFVYSRQQRQSEYSAPSNQTPNVSEVKKAGEKSGDKSGDKKPMPPYQESPAYGESSS